MNNPWFETGVIVLLIVANGLFSMAEIAILTSKKHLLRKQADAGSAGARIALDLAAEPESFLSAVQVGITLIGIVTGVFSGATLSAHAAGLLQDLGMGPRQAELAGMGAIIVAVTYLTLMFGELVPKQIAIALSNAAAVRISPFIYGVKVLFHPVVVLLSRNTSFFSRLLRLDRKAAQMVSDEEVLALVEEAKISGGIEEDESRIIRRTMRLSDKSVSMIMTHRSRVVWINAGDTDHDNLEKIRQSRHTCFPYSQGSLSEIIGIVCVKDILRRGCSEPELRAMAVQPLYVHESTRAFGLLAQFKQTGQRMAVVVDEYGSVEGIVTTKDILEAMVGEINDLDDTTPTIVERSDGSLLVDAHLSLDELFERLGLSQAGPAQTGNAATVSGFVMHRLGRLAREGDAFSFQGHRFEVVDLDGQAIDKVLVASCAAPDSCEAGVSAAPGDDQGRD